MTKESEMKMSRERLNAFVKQMQHIAAEERFATVNAGRSDTENHLELLTQWASRLGLSTRHGDNIHDLLNELGWQVSDLIDDKERLDFLINALMETTSEESVTEFMMGLVFRWGASDSDFRDAIDEAMEDD